ncbi:uncharacterized protein LOC144444778 [Glandiceps talaboti]
MSANDEDDLAPLVSNRNHGQAKKVTFSYEMVEDEDETEDVSHEFDNVLDDHVSDTVVEPADQEHEKEETKQNNVTSNLSNGNENTSEIDSTLGETIEQNTVVKNGMDGLPTMQTTNGEVIAGTVDDSSKEDIGKLEERVLSLLANVVKTDSEKSSDSDEASDPPKSLTGECDEIIVDVVNSQEGSNRSTQNGDDFERGVRNEVDMDELDGVTNRSFAIDETATNVVDDGVKEREIGIQAFVGKGNYRSVLQQKVATGGSVADVESQERDVGLQVFLGKGNYRSVLEKTRVKQGVISREYQTRGPAVHKQKQRSQYVRDGAVAYQQARRKHPAKNNEAMKTVRIWVVGAVVLLFVVAIVIGLMFFVLDRKGMMV